MQMRAENLLYCCITMCGQVYRCTQHTCRIPPDLLTGITAGGGGGEEAMVLVCLPLAAPIGLLPLHISTLCGSERVLVVSMQPLDGPGGGGGSV